MHHALPVLALALCALAGCGPEERPQGSPSPSASTASSSTASSSQGAAFPTPIEAEVLGEVKVGGGACGVIVDAGRVWVSSYADGTVSSIDPHTMKVVSTTRVGDNPCGLAYGAGSVWVENYGSFDVTRVDARSGERQQTYDVQFSPYDVTFADGAAWVTNNGSRSVSRIDAASGQVTTVRTGGHPVGIVAAGGLVWAGLGDGGIAAIDPETSTIVHRIRTEDPAGWTAAEASTVWVNVGDSVQALDARTGSVTATVPAPHQPADGSAAEGMAYVPQRHTGLVAVIEGGAVATVLDTGLRDPFVLAAQGRDLWVADFGGDTVLRVRRPG